MSNEKINNLDEYIKELIKITSEKTGIPIDMVSVNRKKEKIRIGNLEI